MKDKAILVVTLFCFLLSTASFAFEGPGAFDKAAYLRQWTETLQKGDARTKILALNETPAFLECSRDKSDLRAFNPIFDALQDKNPAVRKAAVAALKRIAEWPKGGCAESDISLLLIKTLKDSSPQVRKEAAVGLAYYQDKRALTPLIESLKDKDPWVRLNAAFALGEIGEAGTIQPLLELLNDNADWRNKYVQQECLISIRKIANKLPYFHKQKEVVPVLAEKFDDEYLKAEIIKIVKGGRLCTPYITDEMIRASQNPKGDEKLRQKFSEERKWQDSCVSQFKEKIIMATRDPNEEIRRLSLEALENPIFGGTRKIEQKGQVVTVEQPLLEAALNGARDPSVEVRAKAIESLGKLCPPSDPANPATEALRTKIIETLITALHDGKKDVREKAIAALATTGDKRVVNALIGVLTEGDTDIRKKAIEALGKFNDEKILKELIPLFASKEWSLKEAAKTAFVAIGAKTSQQQVYVYHQNGIRYCVKSQRDIPQEIKIDERNIRYIHPLAVTILIDALHNSDSTNMKLDVLSVIRNFEDLRIKQTLAKLLGDPSPDVRLEAFTLLRDLGADPDINIVIACLTDTNSGARKKAANILGKLRDSRALQPLIKGLADPDVYVREAVAHALGKIGDKKAIDPLLQTLQDENSTVRKAALDSLTNFDDPRIFDANLKMLQDRSPYVRRAASTNIGNKPDKRAVQPLLLLLNDPDSGVRSRAAAALGKIGDRKAVEPLLSVLKKEGVIKDRETGTDGQTWCAAAIALGEIGDQRATPVLIDALNDKQLRYCAIRGLGGLRDTRAISPLLKAAGTPPCYNQAVKEALEAYKDPQMIDILTEYLDDKDTDIKKGAIWMLEAFHDPKAIEPLQRLTNDPDPQIKGAAEDAIRNIKTERYPPLAVLPTRVTDSRGRTIVTQQRSRIQDPQVVPALVEKLKNPDDRVRQAAFNDLASIDDPRLVDLVAPLLGDANKNVACDAARLLGMSGDKRAIDPLTKVLRGQYDRQNDLRDWLLKEAAISALVATGDTTAVDAVIAVAQGRFSHSSPTGRAMIQRSAISALGEVQDDRAIPALLKVVGGEPQGSYAQEVKRSLDAYKNPRMGDIIIRYLGDDNKDIKRGAIVMLGEYREKKAIEPLQRLTNDPDQQIRDAAKDVLVKIKASPPALIVSQPIPGAQQTGVSTSTQPQTAPPMAPETKKIKPITDKLKNKDPKIRCATVDSLGDSGNKEAIPHLIPLLKDENAYVRQAAARGLGKLKAADAAAPLIDRLNDSDLYVQSWTIWALGEIRDPKAIDSLTPFLYHKEDKLRDNAFEALRKFQDPRARRKMVNTLIDHARSSTSPAESMLLQLISLEGDDVILHAIQDPEGNETQTVRNYIVLMEANIYKVSDIAKKGLKDHRDRELVISELSSFIRRVDRPHAPITVQGKIQVQRLSDANDSIRFIGELKDPRGLPILLDILKNRNTYSKSALRTAIDALGNWGYTGVVELFLEILADTNEDAGCRDSAARALGKFGSEKSVKTLIDIVKNDNEKVELRIAAVHSLGDIRDKRAVEPLITALKDSRQDLWFRIASASALGDIGDKKAIAPLQEALKDQALKNAAQGALQKMAVSQ